MPVRHVILRGREPEETVVCRFTHGVCPHNVQLLKRATTGHEYKHLGLAPDVAESLQDILDLEAAPVAAEESSFLPPVGGDEEEEGGVGGGGEVGGVLVERGEELVLREVTETKIGSRVCLGC